MMMKINMRTYSLLHCVIVSQHKLFNEHLVSASGNPALVMRRKKHTEKEVHAHLISVVSVRLREGYTIREISLTKGKRFVFSKVLEEMAQQGGAGFILAENDTPGFLRWDSAGGEAGAFMETQHAYRVPGSRLLAFGPHQENHQGGGDHGRKL